MESQPTGKDAEVVVALAGRRIDAPNAPARFPAARAAAVREQIREFLRGRNVGAIVSSAACGADLLALDVAGELGIRRRVILPFASERFRDTSVIDRGGDWGALYDRVLGSVAGAGDLVVLENAGEGTEAYARTNHGILDEAQSIATAGGAGANVVAVIVWDGAPRGPDDLTLHFAIEARSRGLETAEISTL